MKYDQPCIRYVGYVLRCVLLFAKWLSAKGATMMMTSGKTMYFNIICEELCATGGKIIHVDENRGNLQEIHDIVDTYTLERIKHSEESIERIKWELYPMKIWVPEKRKIITYL